MGDQITPAAGKIKNQPLVSIITPSYNQAQFLGKAILSIKEQDYPRIEHIIIDGGSTDGSLDVLEKYSDSLTWISEPDEGQSQAINKGFARASGEIIGWINSDDFYLPGAVSIAAKALTENPDIDAIYGYCAKVDENGKTTEILKSPEFDRRVIFSNPCIIYQQTVFFRKSLLDKAGLLDEKLHYAMDFDLWIRMAKVGEFKLIPEVLAAYRFTSDCKSVANSEKFWQEVDQIFRRNDELKINPVYLALHKSKLVHVVWNRLRTPSLMKLRNRLFGFWQQDKE